jgi:DNA polymerase-1
MAAGERLLLVDGTALLYRSFYAIRSLSTRAGLPTNAVYGFVKLTGQLLRVWKPTHVIVAFDGGSPASRLDRLPSYKANRKPMPPDLRSQIPLAESYLDCAGLARLRLEGQEADDVIATLAAQARADGADRVLIAAHDKDLYQLVDETVHIVAQAGGEDEMGAAEVQAKMGVSPVQIVDWLALVGDSSDNIPGVQGIGPKTAATLLGEFGNLDALLASLDRVPNERIRSALRSAREIAVRNRELVRLRTDLDCGLRWVDSLQRPCRTAELLALYEKLEFRSLAREISEPTLC